MIITVNEIKDFNKLPTSVKDEIKLTDIIIYSKFPVQELRGYNNGKFLFLAPCTYKSGEMKYEISSYGSNNIDWRDQNFNFDI